MLNRDFREFIELLNANNVKYLIVGGYAVAFHGYPRYTKELDIWIELSAENAMNIVKALAEFGFGSLGLDPDDFLESNHVIQMGYPPNRIDILSTLKNITFEECYANHVKVDIQGVIVNFIDLAHLKKNKLATGRLQDLADVENLE